MASDTYAIVPARNEADYIAATLDSLALAFPGASLIVADDGSIDATAEIARANGALVLRTERPHGKGAAATLAAQEAIRKAVLTASDEHVRSIFLLCDADLGDSAGQLGVLADAVRRGHADMAIATFARPVGGGFGLLVAFARSAIRRRCNTTLRAPLSGQRALSAAVLADALPFAPGFGMEVGLTIDAVRSGHRVREIELDLTHRATARTLGGFAHRARQLADCMRAYVAHR